MIGVAIEFNGLLLAGGTEGGHDYIEVPFVVLGSIPDPVRPPDQAQARSEHTGCNSDRLCSVQQTLQAHISHLEKKIESIKRQLNEREGSAEFQKGLKLNLEIAETSLALFRKAFDLEGKITN